MRRFLKRIFIAIKNPEYAFEQVRIRISTFIKKFAYAALRWFDPKGVFSPYNFPCSVQTKIYPALLSSKSSQERPRDQKISLIATSFNEINNIRDWFESVRSQTLFPDELIVVDAGSKDGTIEFLKKQIGKLPFSYKIIVEPGANIAEGRNIAIRNASGEIIACTDFGCILDKEWLEKITYPFHDDNTIEVAAGFYKIAKGGKLRMRLLGPTLNSVDPQIFLPSSRSIAFRKEAWKRVGGYPEWLSLTGEDTIFAINLRRAHCKWAFVPSAIVQWKAPCTMLEYWHKIFMWSKGDGESGFGSNLYATSLLRIIFLSILIFGVILANIILVNVISEYWLIPFALLSIVFLYLFLSRFLFGEKIDRLDDLISEIGAEWMRVSGFLKGAKNRPVVTKRRFQEVKGFALILAGVPIDDTGGGSRGAQLAWELLNQGYAVLYLNAFPKYESVDLPINTYHPNLVTMSFDDYLLTRHYLSYEPLIQEQKSFALVEFPLPRFLSHLDWLKRRGVKIIYDCIDNWDTSLGASWYSRDVEKKIVEISDVLVATEKSLSISLKNRYNKDVILIPNAVNLRIFDPSIDYPIPDDLPKSKWKSIYIGALWGDWFDWELLIKIAKAYPDMAVIVIGDYRGQCSNPPSNIHFLGLKPQYVLPFYLKSVDVCLIPWKVTPITQATDPLKVYEYLAMHKPVIAPLLEPLRNLPGVWLAQDEDEFIRLIREAATFPFPTEEIDEFIAHNNWAMRVKQLLDSIYLEE